ncbi:DUF6173 family protein [Oceaniglobus ichthyenteri]|uniref:DUF6173 family protein n=1 Tax=Oceaniglobus ichthyenteri TaxID=2136177 RepID=UPI000D3D31BA|nr:DUF6173 family protein [Oceaniglobus ichthyenteri]
MDNAIQTTAELAEAAAMPRAHAVHTDPSMKGAESAPLPPCMAKTPVKNKSAAEWAYQRLVLYIQHFEKQLDEEHEVAMGFVGSASGVMRIEGMGFYDPDIVTFYGSEAAGARTQLIQHVSQLNVFLRAVPKTAGQKEPNRIGFRLAADLEEGDAP